MDKEIVEIETEGRAENDVWQFWLDVGGTFTDCLARRPDGSIVPYKLLSSGKIKGVVNEGSSRNEIIDLARRKDPQGFFRGYVLNLLEKTDNGVRVLEHGVRVESFDNSAGILSLSKPLKVEPQAGMQYELFSDEEAPLTGIRWLKGLQLDQPVGQAIVRLGTTRGTNALLEKQGASTAFITTAGFGDVLKIAYQNRPDLFSLEIKKPEPLYDEVVELCERVDFQGNILLPLSSKEVKEKLKKLHNKGIRSLALCLLNSYVNGQHEKYVTEIAKEIGFLHISASHEVVPLQKIVSRGDTTVVDAYLTPVIRDYVESIKESLPEASVKLMTSAGGLVDAASFVGKDSILSGPAGGVAGCVKVALEAGFKKTIGFDMGGTSTDVSRYDGSFEYRYEMEVNDPKTNSGVRVAAPMLWIETVAAGGGSICWFDGQLPRVGPKSAGADPGPACYGKGGPLTITDLNLFLGRLSEKYFAFPLDMDAVKKRLQIIIQEIKEVGQEYTKAELAAGFIKIANKTMAEAIRKISVARGYDAREYVLTSFGGAGAQHACAIAKELGIGKILQHPLAGVLSAYGIGTAKVKKYAEKNVGQIYSEELLVKLEKTFAEMEETLISEVLQEDIREENINVAKKMLDLRYEGQDWPLTVESDPDKSYVDAFIELHRQHYGFVYSERRIEVCAVRLEVTGATGSQQAIARKLVRDLAKPIEKAKIFSQNKWQEANVYRRDDLKPGQRIKGPAVILESTSTIVVDDGWSGMIDRLNNLVMEDIETKEEKFAVGQQAKVDLITLELFNKTFSSIAEQMGVTLQKTAFSTNVKERMDFSCALFTKEGDLVVNAPHIPVHLGAMSASVKYLIKAFPQMKPGEVYITNDPFNGGSHLPDVTVVSPVFDDEGEDMLFFVANRAHHAEIGGIMPGSMPPFAKNLAEEGVLIKAFCLVSADLASEEKLEKLLLSSQYPSRAVHNNLADIRAQVAANNKGVSQLKELVCRHGLQVVKAYMRYIQDAAQAMMEKALLKLDEGQYSFTDYLDNGSPISVKITIAHQEIEGKMVGRAKVDFSGTGLVVEGNLNANPAIVDSAVLYCFRLMIEKDIPLNEGVMSPLEVYVSKGSLLFPPSKSNPADCVAVAGGNVETSQRIVDVILGALKVVAASQGTMNNLLFGSSTPGKNSFAYYETICGGAGAGPAFPGASAVHTHMTNTRLTDPEVLEARYPVVLREFTIRKNSGGKGKYSGGNGIVRKVEFKENMDVSLLTGRRNFPPYGLQGGFDGQKGENSILPKGENKEIKLDWSANIKVKNGDILIIKTPGGGGYGKPGK